jgi:hypothetical protein
LAVFRRRLNFVFCWPWVEIRYRLLPLEAQHALLSKLNPCMTAVSFTPEEEATVWFAKLADRGLIRFSRRWGIGSQYVIAPFAYGFLRHPFARSVYRLRQSVERRGGGQPSSAANETITT